MRRHLSHVTQPFTGSSAPLRCRLTDSTAHWKIASVVRLYARQPSSTKHAFPQKRHSPPTLLRALRRRADATAAAARAKGIHVAEATDSNPPLASLGTSFATSPQLTDHTADSPYEQQAQEKAATHTPPTSRLSPRPSKHTRRPVGTVSSADLLRSLEAQHSPFAETVRKRLAPRHTGPHGAVADRHSAQQTDEQRRAADELRTEESHSIQSDGYDPALVVQADSRRRQLRLNPVQRELIWTARQRQYHDLLQRIVACLQSHRSPVEKCQTLFALHEEAIQQHLRLRADTYEDIFHTLYSVGVRRDGGAGQPGKASLSASAQRITGDAQWERDLSGHEAARVSGGSLPAELASTAAASSTVLSTHGMEHVWEMYRYSVDSGTDPTARTLQYVMGLLEHASVALAVSRASTASTDSHTHAAGPSRRARSSGLLLVEAKAHSLMMDADRFHLTPSEYTINSYIGICEACDVMHLAVARVTDFQTRHERQPSAGMYARLITGLVRCGHAEDAMAVVTTMQNVPMSIYLLNAVLQAARHSRDPASAFTFYRSLFFVQSSPLQMEGGQSSERRHRGELPSRSGIRLVPSSVTFSILVEVMRATHRYTELDFVLGEMRHFRVRGNGMLLNKLLKLMEASGKAPREREALQRAMENKQIRVFDENSCKSNLPLAT